MVLYPTGLLVVSPVAGQWGLQVTSPNTASNSFGLRLMAGTNINDSPLRVYKADQSTALASMSGAGTLTLTPDAGNYHMVLAGIGTPSGIAFHDGNQYIQRNASNQFVMNAVAGSYYIWNFNATQKMNLSSAGVLNIIPDTGQQAISTTKQITYQATGVRVRRNSVQSIPNNTGTWVIFEEVVGGWGDTSMWVSGSPDEVVINKAGWYSISAGV